MNGANTKTSWNGFAWLDKPVPPRATRLFLAGSVLLALLLRCLWLWLEPSLNRDGAIYIGLASQWSSAGVYPEHDYLPLFPFLIKCAMTFGLEGRAAATLLLFLMSSALPLLAYGIVRLCVACREVALGAALLAAVNPTAIDLACKVQRDTPYLFFAGCTILLVILAVQTDDLRWWAASALPLALGVFCRYETLELAVMTAAYFVVAFVMRRGHRAALAGRALIWCATFFACLFLIAWVLDVEAQFLHAWLRRFHRILLWNC